MRKLASHSKSKHFMSIVCGSMFLGACATDISATLVDQQVVGELPTPAAVGIIEKSFDLCTYNNTGATSGLLNYAFRAKERYNKPAKWNELSLVRDCPETSPSCYLNLYYSKMHDLTYVECGTISVSREEASRILTAYESLKN